MSTTTSTTPQSQQQAEQDSQPPSLQQTPQETSPVDAAILRLKEIGVNLLAIDFDHTILSVHTGGRWQDSLEALLPHVRPEFRQLIPAALANDIQVAIVTFTPQIRLVRGVLDTLLGMDLAQQVPIRGNDRSWQYNGKGSTAGKQAHIASAVEEIETRQNVLITRETTLLIDDDAANIRAALTHKTRAVWLNPKKPHRMLRDISKLP